jgi:TonB family protein
MRRKELPAVAKRLLEDSRTAYTGKDYERAKGTLAVLLQLLDDPGLKDHGDTDDLRILAQGFATLVEAATAPPPAAPPAPEPAAEPAVRTDTLTAPVPVAQEVPVWVPPNAIAGSREYNGAIRVRIGADGHVVSAVIEQPTYPSYDAKLLQIAKQWLYKPALRNGQPVESERVIPIQLRPRE